MKKLIPFILLTSLLLNACSINWNNKEDLFHKNQECLSQKDKILEKLKDETEKYKGWDYTHTETLFEIFYSPVEKNCLYTTKVLEKDKTWACNFFKIYSLSVFGSEIETNLEVNDVSEETKCLFNESEKSYLKSVKYFKWE